MKKFLSPNFKFQISNSNEGFSLLELLIYTAVLAIMSTVIISVFLGIAKSRGKFVSQSEVNSNLRFSIEKINQDIRSASGIITPATGLSSPNLVMTIGADTITYCISSSKLRRQINAVCGDSSAAVTADKVNVTALTFTRFENTNLVLPVTAISVKTSITIAYAGTNPDFQYSATKTTTEALP